MKKWIALVLCTMALLVLACGEKPPGKKTCPEGQTTITASVWVPPVLAVTHKEHRHWVEAVYSCPADYHYHNDGNINQRCHRDHNWMSPEHKAATLVTAAGWGPWEIGSKPNGCHSSCEEKTVTDTSAKDGYWTDPVCEVPPDMCKVEGLEELLASDPLCVEPTPDMCEVKGLEELLADDPLCVEPVIPPPPPPEVCKPISYMWHQCNTGNWTYTPGGSANKCWCGGLNGSRVVKESYDCGKSWTYYLDGERTTQDFSWLGFYKAPACAIGGWCAK